MRNENGWLSVDSNMKKSISSFASSYIDFLNKVKTEREAVTFIKNDLINNGFIDIDSVDTLNHGDKVYFINKNKSIFACVVGEVINGINIIGAHIDSPRLDLKPNPIYEDSEQCLFKTHYYGGIKKYQWTCVPLCMKGVVIKKSGDVINVNIGNDSTDPIFTITDLLPHLSSKQNDKKLNDAIEGENLNVLIGNIPLSNSKSVKENILNILNDKYNISLEDFLSAEIEFVPAFEAKSLGFDYSMVAGYGQDDKACCYPVLNAITSCSPKNACVAIFADKEEIGSVGNTSMSSLAFDNFISKIVTKLGYSYEKCFDILLRSKMLSADVDGAFDSNYKDAFDSYNASFIGHGVCINKYTGSRGKSGASDANAEYVSKIRNIFDTNNIGYQVSELGKIDLGGGGTIAYILANKGMDVIDCGIPVLSMHSPYEVISKYDLYMAYKAYKSFYNN